MTGVCHQCEGPAAPKRPSAAGKNGRPWKHSFCGRDCYMRWRADRHNALKRRELLVRREVWGTTEAERMDAAKAKDFGRRAELLARDRILPALGFTEVEDFSALSNTFFVDFVDFVATREGRRVLVDATIKLKAYVPEKARMATALRMPLFMLHVSIKSDDVFWLNPMEGGRVVSRVPAAFLRFCAERTGQARAEESLDWGREQDDGQS